MKYLFSFLVLFAALNVTAQHSFRAVVKDAANNMPITGAVVHDIFNNGGMTDDDGKIIINNVKAASDVFYISYTGYDKDSIKVSLPDSSWHEVLLHGNDEALDEVVVTATTRTNERIENAPTKVEVLDQEEMGEENTIRPANIASILGDVSGVQIQQTSATSGNMNVRIQGLGGQYTQILRDGMPLYDGFSSGFSILQIPPLDLNQIELIKGSASTLYGGGAIAGLINLISKRPTENQDATITLNVTSLNEADANIFLAKKYKHIGYTLFAGYTQQKAKDVDGDGFSDVPDLKSVMVHPRLFIYPDEKTTLTIGYNGTFDRRMGGDMQVLQGRTDNMHQYYEKDITQRHTGELIFERSIGLAKLTVKGSVSSFNRQIESNIDNIYGNQLNYYSEASVFIPQKTNSFIAGVNVTGDNFKKLPGTDSLAFGNFYNNTVGVFAQYSWHITANTTVEGGLRADHHDTYGTFVLPRLTMFHRFDEQWAMRAGVGLGYKTPNVLEEQLIDYPIEYLQALPSNIKAERSTGYNIEGNFRKDLGDEKRLFINHAFFLTNITSPIVATQLPDQRVVFSNGNKGVMTMGFDTYVKLTIKTLELYLGYTYTDVERKYLPQQQFMPFTPRNRFAFTAMKEWSAKWRAGIEGSFIGSEYRDGDTQTPSYFLAALMVAYKFNDKFSLVANCENLLDYRQTNYEQIYTGPVTDPTFKTLWAPIDGRVVNVSLLIKPFAKK